MDDETELESPLLLFDKIATVFVELFHEYSNPKSSATFLEGTKILVTPEENDETVLMCYDLKQFIAE